MGNCLSNENSVNGRTKARKSKADQRGAKIRLKRSKRRQSVEMDNPVDENLASSAYATTATTTTTTPNPLGSKTTEVVATEASSNHPQQEAEECGILGVWGAQVQVERLQRKWKGGVPMVSCKPPSSTGAAPSSNAQSSNADTNEADDQNQCQPLENESFFSALSDTLEGNVDCPTAEIFPANASVSNGFTPPAIRTLITSWLLGLGDDDLFSGIDPSPMPDLDSVGGKAAAAGPQVLSERTLALHTKSLALMKSDSSVPASPRHAKAESESDVYGSSTDDFSSLENERLSWLEASQEI